MKWFSILILNVYYARELFSATESLLSHRESWTISTKQTQCISGVTKHYVREWDKVRRVAHSATARPRRPVPLPLGGERHPSDKKKLPPPSSRPVSRRQASCRTAKTTVFPPHRPPPELRDSSSATARCHPLQSCLPLPARRLHPVRKKGAPSLPPSHAA